MYDATPGSIATLDWTLRPSDEVLLQEIDGEAILLDLQSEHYFGLNVVGTRLWQLLARDPSLRAAYEILLSEFAVEPERLERDLLALVKDLADAGLVCRA